MNEFVIDAENQVGSTPVMIAAVHGRVECVQRLIDLKAGFEVMDVGGHILKEMKNKLDHISYPRATAALLCASIFGTASLFHSNVRANKRFPRLPFALPSSYSVTFQGMSQNMDILLSYQYCTFVVLTRRVFPFAAWFISSGCINCINP